MCHKMTVFFVVLNMTIFVLSMTGLSLNLNKIVVINVTGFDFKMTYLVPYKWF